MRKHNVLIIAGIGLIALYGFLYSGCATDPIKSIKNNPERMEIMMNHIANDSDFQEKMVEKLMKTGDRQKLAEKICADEEFSKNLVSKIMDSPKGQEDIISRVGNRREYITKALDKAMQMPEYRETILDTLIANKEMLEFMKSNMKFQDALAGKSTTEVTIPADQFTSAGKNPTAEKKTPEKTKNQ